MGEGQPARGGKHTASKRFATNVLHRGGGLWENQVGDKLVEEVVWQWLHGIA